MLDNSEQIYLFFPNSPCGDATGSVSYIKSRYDDCWNPDFNSLGVIETAEVLQMTYWVHLVEITFCVQFVSSVPFG